MRGLALTPIILAMTRPITSSRVVLVEDRRCATPEPSAAPVRRYRLARLRFETRDITVSAFCRTRTRLS